MLTGEKCLHFWLTYERTVIQMATQKNGNSSVLWLAFVLVGITIKRDNFPKISDLFPLINPKMLFYP